MKLQISELIKPLQVCNTAKLKKEQKMKYLQAILMGTFLFSAPMVLVACDQDSSLEEGAEEIADEIDDATTN
jgi:hypothetical protein